MSQPAFNLTALTGVRMFKAALALLSALPTGYRPFPTQPVPPHFSVESFAEEEQLGKDHNHTGTHLDVCFALPEPRPVGGGPSRWQLEVLYFQKDYPRNTYRRSPTAVMLSRPCEFAAAGLDGYAGSFVDLENDVFSETGSQAIYGVWVRLWVDHGGGRWVRHGSPFFVGDFTVH